MPTANMSDKITPDRPSGQPKRRPPRNASIPRPTIHQKGRQKIGN